MNGAPIDTLKAIAHPLRFRILELLRDGERNVGEIEEVSGIGQPALSQQLGVLRKAGLVETRRQAKLIYYSLGMAALNDTAAAVGDLVPTKQSTRAIKQTATAGAANFARIP